MTLRIAIIGAGLAGVSLAGALADLGDVVIFEKSRGVGGRMASRRRQDFGFDHGAQYFTARSRSFKAVVEAAIVEGAVGLWPRQIASVSNGGQATDARPPEPRYVGMPGMTGLAAALAQGLDIRLDSQVGAIARAGDDWLITDDQGGTLGHFDLVISTAPAPQTARLMPAVFSGHAALQSVRMSGCFTLMIGCHQPPELAFDAARLDHPVLSWAAVNSAKPGRAAPFSLVVHSRNDWAEQHLEDDRDSVKRAMLTALTNLTGHDFAGADWIDLHRWRYANVEQALGQPFLFDPENGLAACGDWCLGNRVEAAFESAHSLGEVLADLILPE